MGRGVGRVTAWNTLGTVAGAFLGGFVLIPRIGMRASLTLAAASTAVAGVLALSPVHRAGLEDAGPRGRGGGARRRAAAAGVAPQPARAWARASTRRCTATCRACATPSAGRTCSSTRTGSRRRSRSTARAPYLFYRSNGKTDASTDPGDMANQLLLGHLPMLLHPDPRDVFVLGLGTGVSAAAVARYPAQSIEIADIEGAAREATQQFAAQNRNVLADPRVRFLVADGRNALLARDKTYDVIISDPSDVWVAGVGNLFTREFYALARTRLKPGGVMVQWFHMHSLPPEQMKLIVATFRSVFPVHVVVAAQPRRRDPDRQCRARCPGTSRASAARIESVPGVAEDLRGIGFWHPLSIFAAFVLDGDDLGRMLADVSGLHTDDHPVVEYLSPRAGYVDTTTANDAGVQALQTKRLPAIAGYDEARDFDARARYLLGFGMASIGRYDAAIPLMEESVRGDKPDPKFLIGLGNQYRAKGLDREGGRVPTSGRSRCRRAESEASLRLAELRRAEGDDAGAEKRPARGARARDGRRGAGGRRGARRCSTAARPAEALALLTPALEKDPRSRRAAPARGRGARGERQAGGRARRDPAGRGDLARQRRRSRCGRATRCSRSATRRAPRAAFARAAALDPGRAAAFVGLAQRQLPAGRRRGGPRRARPRARARAVQRRGAGVVGAVRRPSPSLSGAILSGPRGLPAGERARAQRRPLRLRRRASGTPGTSRASPPAERSRSAASRSCRRPSAPRRLRCTPESGFSSVLGRRLDPERLAVLAPLRLDGALLAAAERLLVDLARRRRSLRRRATAASARSARSRCGRRSAGSRGRPSPCSSRRPCSPSRRAPRRPRSRAAPSRLFGAGLRRRASARGAAWRARDRRDAERGRREASRARDPHARALFARRAEDPPQELAGVRRPHLRDVLRRSLRDDPAAAVAALGPEVDDPVGRPDDVEVVLDDDDRVALLGQRAAGRRGASGCRRSGGPSSARRAGRACGPSSGARAPRELDALRLAARERRRRLAELDVAEARPRRACGRCSRSTGCSRRARAPARPSARGCRRSTCPCSGPASVSRL